MYFLGIDGGGTKTAFTLIDNKGNVIISIEKGTCHFNQIGFHRLEVLLKEGLDQVVKGANISREDIAHSFLGLAGYGKVKEARGKIEDISQKVFEGLNYTLDSDIRVAIAGALCAKDGINIIAGTGSIGLAINGDNMTLCGGWGASVGDEGSAYWIGKKAIQIFSKESDGRLEKGPLHNIFMKELQLEDENKIITYLTETINNDRGEIAKLSKLCYMSAVEGDKNAIQIFIDAGNELAQIVKVLTKGFNNDEILLSYTGGVFKSGKLILEPFEKELRGYNIKLLEPVLPPHLGACLLAYIKAGNDVSDEIIENMKRCI